VHLLQGLWDAVASEAVAGTREVQVIRIELAGVDPNNVHLRFANGVLIVSGNWTGDFGFGGGATFTFGNGSTANSGG
jgi:hypothetical protein